MDRAIGSEAYAPADAFDDLAVFESPFAATRNRSRSVSTGRTSSQRSEYSSIAEFSTISRSGRITRHVPAWYDIDDASSDSQSARARLDARLNRRNATATARPRAAVESYDDFKQAEQEESEGANRSDKKRRKLKEKAGKMFTRQFGESDSASEAAPRAAVYKGEMGKSHRRAFAEMGGTAREGRASSRTGSDKAKKLKSKTASRIAIAMGCMVCLAAVFLFLYPTAQQVYLELREEDRLQAEYDAILARNEAMQSRIDYLQTDEGIQDAAREQLGWVNEGEIAVVVEGLSDDSAEEGSSVNVQILSGSVPAPETWYSPILDVVFGYSDPVTVQDSSSQDDDQDSSASEDSSTTDQQ